MFLKTVASKFILIFLCVIQINAIELTKPLLMDMSRTYGFVTGQSSALDVIKNKYPQIKIQVNLTQNEFDLKFSKSVDEIKRILSSKLGSSEWENYKVNLLKATTEQNNSNVISEAIALNFLEEVKSRAKGNIESPVIETLLMFNSTYEKYPIKEFTDGFKKRLFSNDTTKSKGVDFHIDIPKSWKVNEGKRPNTLWLATNNNGYLDEDDSQVSFSTIVRELPEKIESITQKDAEEFCNEAFKDNPSKECIKTTLENLPTIYARSTQKFERLRLTSTMEVANYFVFYDNRVILLQGMVNSINNKLSQKQLNEKFDKYLPLFDQIANSLVVKDLYTKKQESKEEFYIYKLFSNKFQAVFPDTPSLQEFPKVALNPKYIIDNLPYEYKKDLSKKQIEKIAFNTIEKSRKTQPYVYSDKVNQISYTSQNLPSGIEHKNYLYSGIKSQIDEIVKDALKIDNRPIIEFSSTLNKYNDKCIAIYTSYYFLEGQKIYSTTKHIFYKDQVYKWSISYVDKKNKKIFDEYQHNVKI